MGEKERVKGTVRGGGGNEQTRKKRGTFEQTNAKISHTQHHTLSDMSRPLRLHLRSCTLIIFVKSGQGTNFTLFWDEEEEKGKVERERGRE